jgi:hypothetical protein
MKQCKRTYGARAAFCRITGSNRLEAGAIPVPIRRKRRMQRHPRCRSRPASPGTAFARPNAEFREKL